MADRLGWTRYVPRAGIYGLGSVEGLPLGRGYVTSAYGNWSEWRQEMGLGPHQGIDLGSAQGEGTPLYALAPGRVQWVAVDPTIGNYVSVKTARGGCFQYYHLTDRPPVQVGDLVRRGDPLGNMGQTGRTTGPHLHLNYAPVNGLGWVDPAPYFTDTGVWRGSIARTGWSLVQWMGGALLTFLEELQDNVIASATAFVDGEALTYVVGAPAFVNGRFTAHYATGIPAGEILALTV